MQNTIFLETLFFRSALIEWSKLDSYIQNLKSLHFLNAFNVYKAETK